MYKTLMRNTFFAGIFGFGLFGCSQAGSINQAGIQAEGQDIINQATTAATIGLIQGKSLDEVKENVKENIKTTTKEKAETKLKEIDQETTGGIGSAIYESQKK
ncbi:hypothetical protein [Helicobacter marmotae]|uniref:Lipoprotein n=1 Tax=Helicobacter marmotae TaxID=152490 RepID=A0A3D8I4M2_9HELI|nr:hypothetical protein [Helicobacter marmotae]RDU59946.1 hypothetical protein CQA63_05025 [Helicobacter marmotae]